MYANLVLRVFSGIRAADRVLQLEVVHHLVRGQSGSGAASGTPQISDSV